MAQEHDKVLDHTRLQLSALFDGELGIDEARFLQRRLEHDRVLAARWSRWQLAGDVLRGQATAAAPDGF
ncbi:MAG TPA: sigma-E factor negative regulatory protein, partial [Luteimonas sp.]